MMTTPFFTVRQLTGVTGWQARLEGSQEWHPVAAWANVLFTIPGDQAFELILPCIATDGGCIEPTDLAAEIREAAK